MSISSSSSSGSSGSCSSVVVGRGSYGGLKPNPDTTLTCTPPDNDIISSIRSLASWKPHHSVLGITLITLGALCFSCMFLFVKLLKDTADTFTLAFYRALVEIPIALTFCWRSGEHPLGPRQPRQVRTWLLVRGGVGAAAVLCFFYAIQHLPLPDAVTLQFTTPPFAAAFAVCLAGERWHMLDMVGAVVCLLGVMLIAHPSWLFANDASNDNSNSDSDASQEDYTDIAIVTALLGAAFGGLAYTSVRKIGHDASANVMVLYYSVLSLPVTIAGGLGFVGDWRVWRGSSSSSGGGGSSFSPVDVLLIVLTGLSAYAGQYLTNLGLQHETAATGTLATCSQIVFTYIFELTFLHEDINVWSVAGTVLILGFMIIVGFCKMQQADGTVHETVAGETEEFALGFLAERNVRHGAIIDVEIT